MKNEQNYACLPLTFEKIKINKTDDQLLAKEEKIKEEVDRKKKEKKERGNEIRSWKSGIQ